MKRLDFCHFCNFLLISNYLIIFFLKVNVIIVSDHGMTWIGEGSGTQTVPVGDYVNSSYVYKGIQLVNI